MEDKLRQRDAMTEKLRLKNATLKGQLQKVREYSHAHPYCPVEDRLQHFGKGGVLAYMESSVHLENPARMHFVFWYVVAKFSSRARIGVNCDLRTDAIYRYRCGLRAVARARTFHVSTLFLCLQYNSLS